MISGFNHITLAVTDLERSIAFYRDVIGLALKARWNKGAYFIAGENWFCLNVTDRVDAHHDSTHFAFSVTQENFKALKDKILKSGSQMWQENKSEGDSLYFLDPDGHKLEIHVGDLNSRLRAMQDNPPQGYISL